MKRCAVLGNPIEHSKSPDIHHHFAKITGIPLQYRRIEVPLDGLKRTLSTLIEEGLTGVNITVPFKEEVMQYCDHLSEAAKCAQAVNTLRFSERGIEGHNTDGDGLMRDIESRLAYSIAGKRILLLGAGGASRGILKPLLDRHPAHVTISNRTYKRAEDLASLFGSHGPIEAVPWGAIEEPFDLVINATSASLQGVFPPLSTGVIHSKTVGYDLMYADQPTVFMEYVEAAGGAAVYDGLGMLIEQAALSFHYWFATMPESAALYQKMRA